VGSLSGLGLESRSLGFRKVTIIFFWAISDVVVISKSAVHILKENGCVPMLYSLSCAFDHFFALEME
jgi:hypothetical protein